MTGKAQEVEKTINTKVDRFSRESFSEGTKSKWASFKEKASGWNDKMTELIKPVADKLGEVKSDISNSYGQSNNQYVKSFRCIYALIKSS